MSDMITLEQLRALADWLEDKGPEPSFEIPSLAQEYRAHADALEELATLRKQLAERDAKIAALKAHAEAMWRSHNAATYDYSGAFPAYRRDYPEGTK